jgi:hypothetical protein
MSHKTINIFPREQNWRLEFGGEAHDLEFPNKGEAISAATKWAEEHAPCEVLIYGAGWQLERSLVVPDGLYRHIIGWDRRRMQTEIAFPDRRRDDRRRTGQGSL